MLKTVILLILLLGIISITSIKINVHSSHAITSKNQIKSKYSLDEIDPETKTIIDESKNSMNKSWNAELFQSETSYSYNFIQSMDHIDNLSAEYGDLFGNTLLSFISPDQFKKMIGSKGVSLPIKLYLDELKDKTRNAARKQIAFDGSLPTSYDWISTNNRLGYPTIQGTPKYQGICGSCYAHAASTLYEAYLCMNNSTNCRSLSANLVTSCNPQNNQRFIYSPRITSYKLTNAIDGCDGGSPYVALHYMRLGITVRNEETNQMCKIVDGVEILKSSTAFCVDTSLYTTTIQRYKVSIFSIPYVNNIESDASNSFKLKEYIYKHGPAMVKMDASKLQYYTGGTIDNDSLCNGEATQSVVIVGWKEDADGNEVWIIRNSWSTLWGEEGYLFVKIEGDICRLQANAMLISNYIDAPSDRVPVYVSDEANNETINSSKRPVDI